MEHKGLNTELIRDISICATTVLQYISDTNTVSLSFPGAFIRSPHPHPSETKLVVLSFQNKFCEPFPAFFNLCFFDIFFQVAPNLQSCEL